MIVKAFLIASVFATACWLVRGHRRGRRLALTRIAGLMFAGCAVLAILSPNTVTRVANLVGVGRGTDLLLYVFIVAFTFVVVGQNQQIRHLNDRMARLTRAQALLEHEVSIWEHTAEPDTDR
jgi:hypothetical protein